jgi:hypothetical protein
MTFKSRKTALIAAIGAVVLVFTTAGSCDEPSSSAQSTGQAQTEQAYKQQSAAVPYPAGQLTDSLERRNIRERLLRTNKPNAISYVYVMSFGKIIGYYTAKGKVSSTQSQMTPDTFVEQHSESGGGNVTYPAPGDDGSYGDNEPGVYFFLSSGQMVETNLDYIVSDAPLPVDVPLLNPKA